MFVLEKCKVWGWSARRLNGAIQVVVGPFQFSRYPMSLDEALTYTVGRTVQRTLEEITGGGYDVSVSTAPGAPANIEAVSRTIH